VACYIISRNANLEKLNENEFLQDASHQKETGRTRTDFVMKEKEE